MKRRIWALGIAGVLLAGCATAPTAPPSAVTARPAKPYLKQVWVDGRVVIGAQPAASDFPPLGQQGIRHVINLRPASEMATLADLDEPALASAQGMNYLSLPIGGPDHPYSPEVLERFAQAMAAHEGKVLLHCASGARAGQLYAAYLVKYQGKSPEEALRAVASTDAWPLPMERLLNQPLELRLKP